MEAYQAREDDRADLNVPEKCGLLVGLGMDYERAFGIASRPGLHDDRDGKALRESEKMLSGLFEYAPDAILVVNREGIIIRVNEQAQRMFGFSRAELLKQPIEMLMPEQFRARHVADRDAYSASPRIRSMGSGLNIRGRRKSGYEFPVDIMLSPMTSGGEHLVIAIVRDITDQKQLEEAIMHASEKEKQRIGLEIHDDLCQSLVAVTLLCHSLHSSLAAKKLDEQEDAKQVVELLNQVNAHARSMARGLSGMDLTGDAFGEAIMDLAARTTRATKIECKCEIDKSVSFDSNTVAVHVFRIIQQSINNAVTHAEPSHLGIRVESNDGITITVFDDGIGIPDPVPQKSGMGLRFMQYRARLIRASLVIRRRSGGGTEVVCALPKASNPLLKKFG